MRIDKIEELFDEIDNVAEVVRGFMLDKPIKNNSSTEYARVRNIGEFGEDSGGLVELKF